jgi:hypothetical protein
MSAEVFWTIFPFWCQAFAFTLVVEVPLFVLVAARGLTRAERAPIWRLILAGAAGTALTHPLLWFVWPRVIADYTTYIVTGELLVALIESLTFFALASPIRLARAIGASFIANAASYGIGALLQELGWMSG